MRRTRTEGRRGSARAGEGRSVGPEGRGERAFAVFAFGGVQMVHGRVNRVKPPLRGAMDGGRMLEAVSKVDTFFDALID